MSSIVELDLTLTNSSSDRTAIMTPPCASAFLSFLYTLYPREGLKNSSVSISELSQVSVPRIISGDVVSMSTSIFFPFFLILWKLMFKIRRLFFSVLDLGGIGFGEEVAVGLRKDMFELAKLSQF